MPKSPKPPDSPAPARPRGAKAQEPKSKAAKPVVRPLGEHLAALLNPALSEENRSDAYPTPQGFGEAPQAGFDSGPVTGLDPRLAKKLGLETTDVPAARRKGGRAEEPGRSPFEPVGSAATAVSLRDLLERGDPNVRQGVPWTPHRPARPEKSEGGVRFEIASEYEPQGDRHRGAGRRGERAGARPSPARRHRLGQDVHDGAGDRADAAPGSSAGAEQDARRAIIWRI
jgi:excinuclease ABC subunit B